MKFSWKRLLSLAMAVFMVVGLMPLNVLAAESETYAVKNETTGVTYADLATAVNEAANNAVLVLYEDLNTFPTINKPLTIKGAADMKIQVNCAIAENFPNIDGFVYFENLTFNDRISTENASSDQSKLHLNFVNCTFNIPAGNTYAVQGGASWNNDVLGELYFSGCTFNTSATAFTKGYMIYAQCVSELWVKGCTLNGGNVFRGAIHTGDSTDYATKAYIDGNPINGFARGVQIGNRKADSYVEITSNTFANIAAITGETESATVYIHEVADAAATEVKYTGNEVGDSLVVFSENTTGAVTDFVTTFTNNTANSEAIELEGNYSDTKYTPSVPNTIDLSQGSYTIETAGDYTVLPYTGSNTLTVKADANVELQGVNITAGADTSAISIEGGNVTLNVTADSTLTGGDNGAGVYVAEGASVTVKGGTLTAIGNAGTDDASGAAGIGGTYANGASGKITIDGATVIALGYGVWASGIGSAGGYADDISIINGAYVDADGGYYAYGAGTKLQSSYGKSDPEGGAAIGGGSKDGAGVGTITISDSTVKAYGGSKAAGIGAMFWNSVKNITISGNSNVTAQGGSSSAGIGTSRAGDTGVSANIVISGGTVNATGGDYGAGIGGGYNADSLGNGADASALPEISVTVSGGTVNATGGEGGAGIGGGYKTDNVNIDITGGNVTAIAGALVSGKTVENGGAAAAIGSGANGSGKFENSPAAEIADAATVKVTAYYGGKNAVEGTENDALASNVTLTLIGAPAAAGTISGAYYSDKDGNTNRIWGDSVVNASESVYLELYAGETKVATTTLAITDFLDGTSRDLTWSFYIGAHNDAYWNTVWEEGYPNINVHADKVVLYVDGAKVAESAVKMNAPDNLSYVVAAADLGGTFLGYYTDLEDLFNDATLSGEINIALLKDVVVENAVDTSDSQNGYNFVTSVEGGVTLTFGYSANWNSVRHMSIGKGVTLNSKYLYIYGGVFDIYGTVTTDYTYAASSAVTVKAGGVLNATTGDATVQVKNNTWLEVYGTVNAGTVNVWNDGSSGSHLIVSGANAALNAEWIHAWNGGSGSAVNEIIVENGATLTTDAMQADRGATVTVDAATLTGSLTLGYDGNTGALTVTNNGVVTNGVVLASATSTVTGPEGMNVTTTVADHVVAYENGVYSVVEKEYAAQIGETKYETLAEAVEAANAIEGGATVTLLSDITLGEKLTITGNVTIEGAYTITRDDAYTGTLFTVNAGATLTLDGGLTVDGGNEWTMDMVAYNADLEAMTQVASADADKYFTPEEGAPVATAYMIVTKGTVNLNKVTIQNNYSTGSGIVSASKGANVTLTGAQITHNASTSGSGLVVNASAGVYDVNGNNAIIVTMNDGTVIDGNHVGGNHGVFKIYCGTHFIMNGGEIKNTTGWNSNGSAVGVYWAAFTMNGGTICSNSSVYGPSNGRNAAIYLHSASQFVMNGGTICHNSGRSRGGIDAPYTGSEGNAATAVINGGSVLDNVSIYGNEDADVSGGERLTVTGGTFTQDVSKWLAPDLGLVYDETSGKYTTTTDLAEVNGTVYTSIKAAIADANSGDTVKVLASHKIEGIIDVDKDITLDLNGKTITAAADESGYSDAFRILADVTVTGNGTIDADESGYAFFVGDDTTAGKLTIKNGSFYGATTVAQVTKGELIIEGGYFQATEYNGAHEFTLNCKDAYYKAGEAKITVTGGTFYKFNPADNAAEGNGTSFVAEGYKAVADGDTWTVEPNMIFELHLTDANGEAHWLSPMSGSDLNTLIKHGKTWYDSLQGTYDFTLKILESCEVDETVLVTFPMTIDLCGNTITNAIPETATTFHTIANHSDLTIIDSVGGGLIQSNSAKGYVVYTEGGSLVVKGAKIVGINGGYALVTWTDGDSITIEEGSVIEGRGALYVDGGATGTVNGGTLTMTVQTTNSQDNVIYVGGSSVLTIKNATAAVAEGITGDRRYVINAAGTSKVTIADGTYIGGNGLYRIQNSATISVTGGTYNYDPTAICAEGYVAVANEDGTWTVKQQMVAEVNGVQYASIQAAFNAVESGLTEATVVKILVDHEVDLNSRSYTGHAIVVNNKNIVLDMNGKTVTVDYDKQTDSETIWDSFYVYGGSKLTITGEGKFYNKDADASSIARIAWIATNGTMTIENGTFVNETGDTMFYTSATASSATKNSELFIKGGTFQQIGLADGQNDHDCFNMQDATASLQDIVLTGGTFNEDPKVGRQNDWEVTIPDGYIVVDNGDVTWTVVEDIVAEFTGEIIIYGPYTGTFNSKFNSSMTLEEMLESAKSMYSSIYKNVDITLLGNVDAGDLVFDTTVPVKLYGGEYTLNGAFTVADGTTLEIYSGTYTMDVNEWCAEGYVAIDNGDGTWTVVEGTFVAEVAQTGEKYTSLQEAVNAAEAGQTINVIADVTDETVTVDKSLTITGDKTLTNVTITGSNGCELTVSDLTFEGNSWINAGTASKLTVSGVTATNVAPVNGSVSNSRNAFISLGAAEAHELALVVENSKIYGTNGADAIIGWAKLTSATISGNTFGSESAYNNNNNVVKLMGVAENALITFKGNTVYANWNGFVVAPNTTRGNAHTIIVEGNTFVGGADFVWIETQGATDTYATVKATGDNTVNGNAFTAADIKTDESTWYYYGGVNVETNADGKLIGGTYNKQSNKELVAEGYVAVDNADGTWTVVDYIEWIKAELLAGRSVTLEKDIVVDNSYLECIPAKSNGNGAYGALGYGNHAIFNVVGTNVTFDLNGHTITYADHSEDICNKAVVSLFYATDGAKLTITDSKGTAKVTTYGMMNAVYSVALGTQITIEGGDWANYPCKDCEAYNFFLYASHGGELYIKGGKFAQHVEESYLIVWHGSSKETSDNGAGVDYDATKIVVTGGTFVGMNPEEARFFDQSIGNFSDNINAVAEGYEAVETSENVWTVQEKTLFDIYGSNMTLGNDLAMNFFILKSDLNGSDYYVTITKTYADGRDNVVETIKYADFAPQGDLWKVTFNGVAAKEMADKMYVTVYNGDGTAASNQYVISVRDYAMKLLNSDTSSAEVKTTAVDMLNYGAAAQTYFKYNVEDLANNLLTDDQKALATQTVDYDSDGYVKGTNFYGSVLSLESNIVLNLYFTNITSDMHAVVTYTDYRGNSKTVNVDGSEFTKRGDLVGVVVDELVVADGYQLVTCEIYDANNNLVGSASDSVECYVARAMASTLADPIFESLLKFVSSARTYLLTK